MEPTNATYRDTAELAEQAGPVELPKGHREAEAAAWEEYDRKYNTPTAEEIDADIEAEMMADMERAIREETL